MSQSINERPQLTRSESIFQRHDLTFDFDYSSEEEDDNHDSRSDSSEVLACEEEEANDQQDIFRQEKMSKYEDYTQVMQILVECIKSAMNNSGYGVICIEKSNIAKEYYIYMPITANIYTVPIDHTLSAQYLIDYIISTTPEFIDLSKKGTKLDFVLDGYALHNKTGYCETPDETDTANFLRLPLDKVPLSQATFRVRPQ